MSREVEENMAELFRLGLRDTTDPALRRIIEEVRAHWIRRELKTDADD